MEIISSILNIITVLLAALIWGFIIAGIIGITVLGIVKLKKRLNTQ